LYSKYLSLYMYFFFMFLMYTELNSCLSRDDMRVGGGEEW
jgi:hypothetical protein